ncbi:hypothetical protein BCE75_11293 [Isoptericola sp. CG 20/1183]|uniref:Energy-coupling factor transport system substrate-specific component n=1 Tax=Isoptericola halotolerans TaxID=300560 RepID=A0ABX5EAF4_9MICO|nr:MULTISPECIES: DUF6580 family putative transport protein [Isoptericola]MCK0115663.1 hypothetical protein [Isoptericola sp. S6320L]PRZ03874.1 hypothetical protein BCE75_11293 [Isoptericola sp. CG 20/1183]PRZ03993.1 hypothetical protein BCL65_11127 [Isoptericola halotolerans]
MSPAPEAMPDLSRRDLAERWWRPAVATLLVVAAIVWRLVKDDLGAPPNLELSTFAAFAAAGLLRHRLAMLAPLVVVAVSDVVLSNSAILVFTWSAWAAIGVAAWWTRRATGGRRFLAAVAFGAGSSIGFYLWTNFGVWLQGRGTFYPAGLDGLVASYVAGLPFLRPMLLGNLVLLPVAAAVVALVERLERVHSLGTVAGRA